MKRINVYVTEDLYTRVGEIAEELNLSKAAVIRKALQIAQEALGAEKRSQLPLFMLSDTERIAQLESELENIQRELDGLLLDLGTKRRWPKIK